MKRKKAIIIPLICVAVVAVIVVGVILARNLTAKPVDVIPVSNIYSENYQDSVYLDGNVTSGKTQNVALKDGLVESVSVEQGDVVKKGDILMTYDATSYKLILMNDEAAIALLESNIHVAKTNISKYSRLKTLEEAPPPTEVIIHHPLDPVDCLSAVISETAPSLTDDSGTPVYNCTPDTVVSAGFLQDLQDSGKMAVFRIYRSDSLHAAWIVNGATLTPKNGTDFEDWRVGDGLSFGGEGNIGDGTLHVDSSAISYGTLYTYIPEHPGEDEIQYIPNYEVDADGNYAYTKAELAEMIAAEQKNIQNLELQLRQAELTYRQDKLEGSDGNVRASIDGTVSYVGAPLLTSVGNTIITVKGDEKYNVTFNVSESMLSTLPAGTAISVQTYESGNTFDAIVDEVGENPVTSYSSWNENPNNSYYPVTCVVEDDVSLIVGEWCQATLQASPDAGMYIPMMYVRSDAGGSYIMLRDENERLTKRYVATGKTLWGSMIEIKGGLRMDDYIAFPYGKDCREGAKTNINQEMSYW